MGLTGLVGLLPFLVCAAEKSGANITPRPESKPASGRTVETLAELTRPSVVVISQFGRDGKPEGVGAGFVIATNGLIATSLHVIGEARPVSVRLASGQQFEVAEIRAWDRKRDLAILRIDAGRLPALALGDSDTLKQGASVVAMGNPLGLEHSIVQGIVSAKRDLDGQEMIQLAIPIEPGNSGGPLLDLQGRVQGLLNMKSAMTANLGFAIPINALKPLLQKPNPVPMKRWLMIGALNPREWQPILGGRWRQKAAGLQVEGAGAGFGGRALCLWQPPVPAPPYEIAVTVRLDDEAGAAGLIFASDGDQKHYGFYPSAGQLRLTRFDGPDIYSWTILQQVRSPHYRPGEWNELKVRREKNRILCYLNGHLVIESEDAVLQEGKVGLAKFRDTTASFRNFQLGARLTAPSGAPPANLVASITRQLEGLAQQPEADVVAVLQTHPEASRTVLAERAARLETEAGRLRRLALALNRHLVQSDLVKALQEPEEKIDLFYAALLVSKLDNPDLDLESYRRELDDMARELMARLPRQAGQAARLTALTNYLFAENGFHGSRTDYHNRANSYINDVLDDREGLPITLSVLFLELGRRIGLTSIAGVSLPGHFMVKYISGPGADQLLDVFDAGKPVSRAEAAALVRAYTDEALRDEQLQPATKREIIIRMLRNLLNLGNRTGTSQDSLRYLDVIVALAPDSALDRLARASLRLQSGDPAGARQDFKWLLDHQPPGLDLDRIRELYRTLF
jgi:S1-C subfamily serine protease/regulator of sirC expression with transglutaminase-like and TPR domain